MTVQDQLDELFTLRINSQLTDEQYESSLQDLQQKYPTEMADFARENGIIKSQGLDALAFSDNYEENAWTRAAKDQARYIVEPAMIRPTVTSLGSSLGFTRNAGKEDMKVKYAPALEGDQLENVLVHESMHAVDPLPNDSDIEAEGTLRNAIQAGETSAFHGKLPANSLTSQEWFDSKGIPSPFFDYGAKRRINKMQEKEDALKPSLLDKLFQYF